MSDEYELLKKQILGIKRTMFWTSLAIYGSIVLLFVFMAWNKTR